MNKYILITAIGAVYTTAFAADMSAADLKFDTIDANLDGVISLEEATPFADLVASFTALDLDADGQLSEVEFAAKDADNDGILSTEELSMLTVHAE
ncbi:MAG: hypothetical protein R3227_09550 [Reinekea sp.]|nr:hypothetical protein [Reinekea sp.]